MSGLEQTATHTWLKPRQLWLVLGIFLIWVGVLGLKKEQENARALSSEFANSQDELQASQQLYRDWLSGTSVKPPPNDYYSIPYELLADGSVTIEPEEAVPEPEPAPVSVVQAEPQQEEKKVQPVTAYVVQSGDNLWSIAQSFNLDVSTLAAANNLNNTNHLRPGQKLEIPPSRGIFYRVRSGESLWDICRRYEVELEDVLAQNEIKDAKVISVGQRLFLPGASPRKAVTDIIWPVRGRLTSRFGLRQHPMGGGRKMHSGIDIACPPGRLVRAAQSGKVTFSGPNGAMGRTVILQHEEGYETVYGHNSELLVRVGQRVQQGQAIARSGNTGLSTGPHLHFELRKSGRAIDPLSYLPR